MLQENRPPLPKLSEDEKMTPVMLYTSQSVLAGQVISKLAIRVSTWLRTDMAPKYLNLRDVQVLLLNGGQTPKSLRFTSLYVQTEQIIALHLKPPDNDPLDYDPKEPNRIMLPTTALVAPFQFDGLMRMSGQTDLPAFLGAAKGEFLGLYAATMSCPILPALKSMQTEYVLLRQRAALFTER